METKSEYKMTEVGEIPIDWEVNKLKSIGKFSSGTGFPEKYQGGKDSKDIPFFKVSDMNLKGNEVNMIVSNNYVNSQAIAEIKAKVIDKKSIIFAKVGAAIFLERKRKVSSPFLIDNNMMAFSSDKSIDFNYLYYLFSRIRLSKYAQVGALPSYNASDIGNIKVAYPESSLEQQKIAEILSTVDEQIEQTDQLIEKTKELKKGLMQQLLTKGIGHSEFKQTELGEIPVEWEIKKFKEVMILQRGHDLPIQNRKSGDIPILSANGITGNHNISKVDGPGIVTGRSGTIGKVHYIEQPYWPLNTSLYVKEMYNNIPKFLYYFLINFNLKRFSTGTGVPTLNRNDIHSITVTIPSVDEQKKIAEILSSVDEDIEGYEEEKAKYEELKKGLMQQLLTGKKRVKVD